jgi:hypothetical protein
MSRLQKLRCTLRLRTRARELYRRIMRRLGFLGQEWDKGLPEELQAWEFMLKDHGRNWVMSEYHYRLDPEAELQDEYKRLIDAPPGGPPIKLLDVGAGPLTSFGKRWEGRALQLFPVDPQLLHNRDTVKSSSNSSRKILLTWLWPAIPWTTATIRCWSFATCSQWSSRAAMSSSAILPMKLSQQVIPDCINGTSASSTAT